MTRKQVVLMLVAAVVLAVGWIGFSRRTGSVGDYTEVARQAKIRPDYTGTVIPVNIAPMNFVVQEEGEKYLAKIYGADEKKAITVRSKAGKMKIPKGKWKKLLQNNKGGQLFLDIYVRQDDGKWRRFEKIVNTIAYEEIDSYLVYRFIKPLYNWWYSIGVYQRNLESFDRTEVLHGRSFGNGCVNCHTFLNNRPDRMTMGIRSTVYGSSTLLAIDGKVSNIGTKWGYTSWHPSGELAVYSLNKVRQFFHRIRMEQRDVIDLDSALVYYVVDTQEVKTISQIAEKDRLETYPAWSPDGGYLYFCSAPILWENRNTLPPENYDKVRYDLKRISYDMATDQWGQVETVLSSQETDKSILLPRITPDGRFLVFTMCNYGCFPVYSPDSDLYIMNLQTRHYRKMPVNSEYSDSWHSFSSNSRWMAFSSKKQGGLFTRTFFCYIDDNGEAYKPFVLPQKDATYYDSLMQTYSVPELLAEPIEVSSKNLAQAVRSTEKIEVNMPLTGATPKGKLTEPWQQERE